MKLRRMLARILGDPVYLASAVGIVCTVGLILYFVALALARLNGAMPS